MTNYSFIVNEDFNNKRIDQVVANQYPKISRTKVNKIIKNNLLKLNGNIFNDPSVKVKLGDQIEFENLQEDRIDLVPKKMDLKIIFEDEDIIIIDKPIDMVVHPGAGNFENTMVNGLLYHCKNKLSGISGEDRPGIVHRIDKNTSGLVVIAKNNFAHEHLSIQFNKHSIKRIYQLLVWGKIRPPKGKIETLIVRSSKNRQLMEVSKTKGKKAITNYKTIEIFENKNSPTLSYLECELETGRTHQIRVHMNYLGNSIVGDDKYKKKFKKLKNVDQLLEKKIISLNRQFLHAKTIGFNHPTKKKEMIFNAILPQELEIILKMLRKTTK